MKPTGFHPGIELQKILNTENISQRDFAAKIDIPVSLLNSILKGSRNITVAIAISLEAAGYKKAIDWMEIQINHSISETKKDEIVIRKTDDITNWKNIKELIPFNYLKKGGFLKNEISSDIETIYSIYKVDNFDDLKSTVSDYKFQHFRKSKAFTENKNNVIGWSKLAEYQVEKIKVKSFDKDKEHVLIEDLKKCFYRNKETISATEKILNKYGIKFLVLDRPEKTPVDGKCFMSGENPAIVLSLKYKRLDNFAFNIMHEIGHIFLHLSKPKYQNTVFFENKSNTDKEENEANIYASDNLIDPQVWTDFIHSNFDFTDKVIIDFSKKIKVHPGIIRGRVCYDYPEYYTKRSTINVKNILNQL